MIDYRRRHEYPEGSGLTYVQMRTFSKPPAPETEPDLSPYSTAVRWSRINAANLIAAEVSAGLAYIPLSNEYAKCNDFLHNGSALMHCTLEKLLGTKYERLDIIASIPLDDIQRPSYWLEPEHIALPAFEPIISRVYHEEIPHTEFQELIAQALPINENFKELVELFHDRWQRNPMFSHLVD